jgi:hypothetical protein
MTQIDSRTAIAVEQHRPVKVEYPKRTVFLCARCLVIWPCLSAQQETLRKAAHG